METVQGKAFDCAPVLKRWYRATPRHMRAAFLSALLAGLLVHLYMLTNKFPNHDDIAGTFVSIDFLGYGWWLSRFFEQVNTNLSMPWVNGVLALIFAALSAALVVQLLNIRSAFFAGLTVAVLACMPVMAIFFTFMCGADVFLLVFFLGVLEAYFSNRGKYGFLIGTGLFTIALTIYQTMALFAFALMMVKLLLDVLDRERGNSEVIRTIWHSIASVAMAAVLYDGLTKLILHIQSASQNQLVLGRARFCVCHFAAESDCDLRLLSVFCWFSSRDDRDAGSPHQPFSHVLRTDDVLRDWRSDAVFRLLYGADSNIRAADVRATAAEPV